VTDALVFSAYAMVTSTNARMANQPGAWAVHCGMPNISAALCHALARPAVLITAPNNATGK
jgi:hypothetical protein